MDKVTHALAAIPPTGLALGGMSVEMTMLVLSVGLGFISIFLASRAVTSERGIAWNTGARDNTAPLQGKVTAVRTAHRFNRRLLEALFADDGAWEYSTAPAQAGVAANADEISRR